MIAYLDRIRKAKAVSLRRRPRHRRHKSDPVDSVSAFINGGKSEAKEKFKHKYNSSSETLFDVGQADATSGQGNDMSGVGSGIPVDTGALSTRFAVLEVQSDSKHFKSPFSSSDSAIHNQVSLLYTLFL